MQELFGSIGSSSHLEVQLNAWRVCVRCDARYQERDNIGRWACAYYHPLSNFVTLRDKTFACCGQDRDSYGCVRADHTDSRMVDLRPKLVNRALVALLDDQIFDKKSCHPDMNGGYIVHRYDTEAHQERCSVTRLQPNNSVKLCATKQRPVF